MSETDSAIARVKQRYGNVDYVNQPYWAEVEMYDRSSGSWSQKGKLDTTTMVTGHTMFPDGWSRQRVYDEVKYAYKNKRVLDDGSWIGPSRTGGFEIAGYPAVGIKQGTADAIGNMSYDISTAFPKP